MGTDARNAEQTVIKLKINIKFVSIAHSNKLRFLFCQLEGKVTACKRGLILLTSVKVCSACLQ